MLRKKKETEDWVMTTVAPRGAARMATSEKHFLPFMCTFFPSNSILKPNKG